MNANADFGHIKTEDPQKPLPLPERQLIASVLICAILDAHGEGYLYSNSSDTGGALRWLADGKSRRKFSLRWCCDHLGLDVDAVQESLQKHPDEVVMLLRSVMGGRQPKAKAGLVAA